MKGKYKVVFALLLLLILTPLMLLMTSVLWLPMLAGIWLPAGTRIVLDENLRLTRHALKISGVNYLAGDCRLAHARDARLSGSDRWKLNIAALDIDSACLAKLPPVKSSSTPPRTLAQWQSLLPDSQLTIERFTLSPWKNWQGTLSLALTPTMQEINYQGEKIKLRGHLHGRQLTVSQMEVSLFASQPPLRLSGSFTMPVIADSLPVSGHAVASFTLPLAPSLVDAQLKWHKNAGLLTVTARDNTEPLLDLPWTLTRQQFTISDGHWRWPYAGFSLRGRVGAKAESWQAGLEAAQISGRLSALSEGEAGKGNSVLTVGPGKLSALPLRLTGEVKHNDLILYAMLPARLRADLSDARLIFSKGALLRSRGRIMDTLDIDEARWPLAGINVTSKGVDGRLRAIFRAHKDETGDVVLHLDGRATHFRPGQGLWQWRYWGAGHFTPMRASWNVAGRGEWRNNAIMLADLRASFDQLRYGAMLISKPRLALEKPVIWLPDAPHPRFSGMMLLDSGETTFTGAGVLPPATLKFSVTGTNPKHFQYNGELQADKIGPVKVRGRWDGERLRGQAWWPEQALTVFQPLIPPEWKMNLRDGKFYAQIAFSAALQQGLVAGGHAVLKGGSAWMPDNEINGVDFVLPFRFSAGRWRLGVRDAVTLRIAEITNQIRAENVTADLQGTYPWSEDNPLWLTGVSIDTLGGKVTMQQLRLPQREPALLRIKNISSSQLISAVNPKQFAMSGPIDGALPLWLNNGKWIIKDGWLTNPGKMTLRIDQDTADAIMKDNMVAGTAINWLRYMEISRSWTKINLDNPGLLTMQASISGTSHVDGKTSGVRLNYLHEENVFALWRSLRFGDNLLAWLRQNLALPEHSCLKDKKCEE